jgi:hypothetical protein
MNELLGGGMGVVGVVIFLFLLVLAVLWFLLPFAIFGTKDKLAVLIAESKQTNAELARIAAELVAARLGREHQTVQASTEELKSEDDAATADDLGITHDGTKYYFRQYAYDNLEDAVKQAKYQIVRDQRA